MALRTHAIVLLAFVLVPFQVLASPTEFKLWAMEAHTEGRTPPHFDPG
ncbi:MAG: hypothetical protein IT368_16290, partial [Candidatus Hydrogenedentes bacterium]|nr:hypothetical protein [Candidatus Hydrogenedentota bacterium]